MTRHNINNNNIINNINNNINNNKEDHRPDDDKNDNDTRRYVAQRHVWPLILYKGRKCHVHVYVTLTCHGQAFVHCQDLKTTTIWHSKLIILAMLIYTENEHMKCIVISPQHQLEGHCMHA